MGLPQRGTGKSQPRHLLFEEFVGFVKEDILFDLQTKIIS